MSGGTGADWLYGENGADTLDGDTGADTMVGGLGDDTYFVDNALDKVIESADPDNIEEVILTGTDNINATANNAGCYLTGNTGDNYLKGGDGLDFMFGDEGADTLEGGAGDDYYLTDNSDTVIEQAGGGLDQIWAYGDGIKMADNVERLYMQSFLAKKAYGNDGNNRMQGNNQANTLYGYGGNDTLSSGSGNDTLYGGLGNDLLIGGTGNDTYHFQRGDGADTIQDIDGTAGNQDVLDFDGAINANQLWLTQSNSDLVISVIGTTDKVTISNWYLGSTYQVESIVAAGDGKSLDVSKVQSLVDAMAAFTPPTAGQTTLPANYQSSLNNVLASSWA